MTNNGAHVIRVDRDRYYRGLPVTSKKIARVAVKFFRDSFKKQGKTDGVFRPWKRRKFEFPGKSRSILVKRGNLVKSLAESSTFRQAHVHTAAPYGPIHNEGGTIRITSKMRRFFWAKHKEAKSRMSYRKNGQLSRTVKNRKLSSEAEIWKSLALTKKTHFKIPARPFMYHSRELTTEIDKLIDHLVLKTVRK